ncbi:putative non-specific protein-tyrosine kinase [Rosa chinensis]|uniref:Putative non-specific protein-tyrosine kinase n=1 Tax=Rosa chinensis TaxID=74649 RepID=A0A2P6REX7_ROSCH|nr:putative non-specific protein-tyrosine kinase [Rosa chinensis]
MWGYGTRRYRLLPFCGLPTDTPLTDSLGVLTITHREILVLVSQNNSTVWSSNTSRTAQNPVAQLSNSRNPVVKDGSDNEAENFRWQSYDITQVTHSYKV